MTDNKIRDEGARALSEMLKVNTTFIELYLGGEEEERKRERERQERKRKMNDRQWDWR